MIGYIFCKKNGNIFKFRVDTLEHLHTKYFSLSWMSNLRSQYLPIAFQLSNGSCKIRDRSLILLLSINSCMLIIPMPPFSTPKQQTLLSIWLLPPPQIKPHTKVVISFTYFSGIHRISMRGTTKKDQEIFHY